MVAVPDVPPVATPLAEPIETTDVRSLCHVPPAGVLPSVVEAPWQMDSEPVMPPGRLFTVAIAVVIQPVPSE